MLHLTIKGSPLVTVPELNRRGIPVLKEVKQVDSDFGALTAAKVDERYFRSVADWYHEPTPLAEGEGFAPGTLLLYSW